MQVLKLYKHHSIVVRWVFHFHSLISVQWLRRVFHFHSLISDFNSRLTSISDIHSVSHVLILCMRITTWTQPAILTIVLLACCSWLRFQACIILNLSLERVIMNCARRSPPPLPTDPLAKERPPPLPGGPSHRPIHVPVI